MLYNNSSSRIINVNNLYMHDDVEDLFFETFCTFEKRYGCTYLAFMLEGLENMVRVNFISNKAWHNIFINDHYIDFCPLVEVGRLVDSIILNWNSVPINTKSAREVVGVRADHNIANGISFANILDYCGVRAKEMIGMGADIKHYDFARLIVNDISNVQEILKKLRTKTIHKMLHDRLLLFEHVNHRV